MGDINFHTREILLKIVYYGPALSGKTTALRYLQSTILESARPAIARLDVLADCEAHFEFLPVAVTRLHGFDVRLHLYSVPGRVLCGETRELILRAADGVAFVADSRASRLEGNIASLDDLQRNLQLQGTSLQEIPFVIQYNKRDLQQLSPISELESLLNATGAPSYATVATQGRGLEEGLRAIAKLSIRHYVQTSRLRT